MIAPPWANSNALIQPVRFTVNENAGVRVDMLREDLRHPFICGNKWWKLKYFLQHADDQKKNILISVGGSFSNHLLALAAAGNEFGFRTIGLVRGEELNKNTNSYLKKMHELGMQIEFYSRQKFDKGEWTIAEELKEQSVFIPMGGADELGIKGAAEMLNQISDSYDFIFVASGTATTAFGISNWIAEKKSIAKLFAVNCAGTELKNIENHKIDYPEIQFLNQYHFGGFAKSNAQLHMFVKQFENETQIKLDDVYNSKMMFALMDQIHHQKIPAQSKVLAIHTGGVFNF